jgi:sulfite reductase (NADPH) hemoprotein beta-component
LILVFCEVSFLMAKATKPEPLLRTPVDQMSGVEQFKFESNGTIGNLAADFADLSMQDVVEATEQVAKSHGIYLEYNRATTGKEKDWMYMIRISVPGGGGFTLQQWQVVDEVASKYTANPDGVTSLRLTTRQNIQFHWVHKKDIFNLVREVAHSGYFTLNGCGDNARNVMGCPLSKFSTVFDANAMAHHLGAYFRLPAEAHISIFEVDTSLLQTPEKHFNYGPRLLNRKFKIGVGAVHQDENGNWYNDNCVEMRTNDVGIAPIIENGKVDNFMFYIGGGQGEKLGKPTMAALGLPLGVVSKDQITKAADAIATLQQEWGDRANRHWARLKYVVQAQGINWWQNEIKAMGVDLSEPIADFYPGTRCLHHGWEKQPSNGLWAYGAYIENGRLSDAENGNLKTMVPETLAAFPGVEAMITPNQDLLFVNIPEDAKADFVGKIESYGQGKRHGKALSQLRVLSGACVGLPTCRLATADSERYEPTLIDQMEELGYGDTCESIGITGCERQCFRPATKSIGLIGQGPGRYSIKLGGSEDGSTQGQYISDGEKWYLALVTDDVLPKVLGLLIDHHKANRKDESEGMGAFHQRIGMNAIINMLKANELTAPLMEKSRPAPYAPEQAADVLH